MRHIKIETGIPYWIQPSSVQLLSRIWLFPTPWTAARQACLSNTNCRSLPKPCPLSRWCHPIISSSVVLFSHRQSFPASGSFQMCQLSFSISPSNEYSGLTCFRTDWLDLLAVQGTLKSLFQHHSSKASIL